VVLAIHMHSDQLRSVSEWISWVTVLFRTTKRMIYLVKLLVDLVSGLVIKC